MGFGYVFGATPALESASWRMKLFTFLEGDPVAVSPLKFGAAYPVVIYFNCNFFVIF
jgi:hypothetical protein